MIKGWAKSPFFESKGEEVCFVCDSRRNDPVSACSYCAPHKELNADYKDVFSEHSIRV